MDELNGYEHLSDWLLAILQASYNDLDVRKTFDYGSEDVNIVVTRICDNDGDALNIGLYENSAWFKIQEFENGHEFAGADFYVNYAWGIEFIIKVMTYNGFRLPNWENVRPEYESEGDE